MLLVTAKELTLEEYFAAEYQAGITLHNSRATEFAKMIGQESPIGCTETVLVVAKKGQVEDWAAYSGWPVNSQVYRTQVRLSHDPGTVDGVMRFGNKIDAQTASFLFPEFVATGWKYRG